MLAREMWKSISQLPREDSGEKEMERNGNLHFDSHSDQRQTELITLNCWQGI